MATETDQQNGAQGQPAAQASNAREWLEIARQDIEVMRLCHDNGHYGSSAYHCQQALEKIIKFTVVKYGLVEDPADLNHYVVEELVEQLMADLPEGPGTREAWEMARELLRALRKSSRGGEAQQSGGVSPKDSLWLESLGVTQTSPKLAKMMDKAKMPPTPPLEELFARCLPEEHKDIMEDVQEAMKKGDKNSAIMAAFLKPTKLLWEKFKEKYKPDGERGELGRKEAKVCLLLWLMANMDTFLKATPDVEYGRYPGVMRERSRIAWYSEHRDDLLALETSACMAFDELCEMVGN